MSHDDRRKLDQARGDASVVALRQQLQVEIIAMADRGLREVSMNVMGCVDVDRSGPGVRIRPLT
jgi:hypothetical protein